MLWVFHTIVVQSSQDDRIKKKSVVFPGVKTPSFKIKQPMEVMMASNGFNFTDESRGRLRISIGILVVN